MKMAEALLQTPNDLPVLLVDDSPTNLRITGAVLTQLGCSVTSVLSGADAVRSLSTGSFALVLLDYQMPDMDGPATARKIKEVLRNEAPPMIALTGEVDLDIFVACRDAGMRLVLRKPVQRQHLEALVDRARLRFGQTA